jgi:SAM-dependent methyltransferase
VRLEHLGRYLFAADVLRHRRVERVVDAACGTGFGAAELADTGIETVAVDRDPTVLAYAAQHYNRPGLTFVEADLEGDELLDIVGVGGVVCFETLEHLIDPDRALRKLRRLLPDRGVLICSVPARTWERTDVLGFPRNTRHRQLFSLDSAVRLVERAGFVVEHRLGQPHVNRLMRRESKLKNTAQISRRLGDMLTTTDDDLRDLARLLAYPTVEDIEESYTQVLVASTPN